MPINEAYAKGMWQRISIILILKGTSTTSEIV